MRGKIASVALTGLLFAACSDPALEGRVAELEKKVADMDKRPAAPPGAAGAAAQRPPAPAADSPEEAAANQLLKEANDATAALNYDLAKSKLAELDQKYPNSKAAKAAVRMKSEMAVVGKPAVAIDAEKWMSGAPVDLNAGKATLVVFWEVWCPHCKREVPKLEATYEKYRGQGLQMVGATKMTRDVTEAAVNQFVADNKIQYPVVKETGKSSEYYGVEGIPAAVVIKDGAVVWRGHPARLTDAMFAQWLGGSS